MGKNVQQEGKGTSKSTYHHQVGSTNPGKGSGVNANREPKDARWALAKNHQVPTDVLMSLGKPIARDSKKVLVQFSKDCKPCYQTVMMANLPYDTRKHLIETL